MGCRPPIIFVGVFFVLATAGCLAGAILQLGVANKEVVKGTCSMVSWSCQDMCVHTETNQPGCKERAYAPLPVFASTTVKYGNRSCASWDGTRTDCESGSDAGCRACFLAAPQYPAMAAANQPCYIRDKDDCFDAEPDKGTGLIIGLFAGAAVILVLGSLMLWHCWRADEEARRRRAGEGSTSAQVTTSQALPDVEMTGVGTGAGAAQNSSATKSDAPRDS